LPEFICTVGTASGEVTQRVLTGESEEAVRAVLAEQDLLVLSLRRKLGLALPFMGGRRRVSAADFLVFNQELKALLKAGLPILGSLDMLIERQKNPVFRQALVDTRDEVRSGASLSEAFGNRGSLFPPLFATSLASGERSGEIVHVLDRYISYTENVAAVRQKIVTAAIYPLVLLVAMLIVVVVMIVYVLPMFGGLFETMNVDVPLPTQILLGMSDWITGHFFIMVLSLGSLAAAFAWWKRTPAGARALDRMRFALPLVGEVFHKYAVTRFTRTLGTLLSGGIPMVAALQISSRTVGNIILSEKLDEAGRKVKEGGALWESLEATGLMPEMAVGMIRVGESSGALTDMLDQVSEFLDSQIDKRIQMLLALMEPVLLLGMAVVVGGLILAIYMPLMSGFSNG
jgi:type IV pilus assembly protein PilC